MSDHSAGWALLLAAILAPVLAWKLATHSERWRRIRRDVKTQWKGLRTLVRMLRREARHLAETVIVVVLAAAAIIALIVRSGHVQ